MKYYLLVSCFLAITLLSACEDKDLEVTESESVLPSHHQLNNNNEPELAEQRLDTQEVKTESSYINNESNNLYETEDQKFKAYAEHTAKAIEFYTLKTNIEDSTTTTDLSEFYPVEHYLFVYDNDIKGIDLSLNGLTSYNEISVPMLEVYKMVDAAKDGDIETFSEYAKNDLEFVKNLKEYTQIQNDSLEVPKSIEELTGKTIEQQYEAYKVK